MKKQILPFILLLCLPISAQEIIKNSNKPNNKTAGRIVKLEEVLRIEEEGKNIIFRYPYDLQIGPDNGIYFYDSFQLYKFDSKGNFVCKFLKFGQGPGDTQGRTRFTFLNDSLIVQAGVPPKILTYDLEGKYIDEVKTEIPYVYTNFFNLGRKLMGFLERIDESVVFKEGYFNMPIYLYEVNIESNKQKLITTFPIKHYIKHGSWWQQAFPVFTFNGIDSFFIVHTEDYQIKEVNLSKNIVERIITRKYDRVKYVPSEEILKRLKKHPNAARPPLQTFVQDIRYITLIDENLWVLTSASDDEGRPLIDVFDKSGNYINKFYLDFPDTLAPHRFNMSNIVINSGYVFTIDQGTDDFYSIAKYKIVDD